VYHAVPYRAREALGRWPLLELLAENVEAVLVRPDELEAWYLSDWTFVWRGQPFLSKGVEDGRITGEYRGEDEEFAKANLKRSITAYRCACPLDEVAELTEHRTDLLARLHEHERRFAEADWFRPGTFAVYEGRTYAADSHPNALYEITISIEGDEGSAHRVSLDDVEAWYMTKWTFTWQGGPFDALGVDDGLLKGSYTGGQRGFADAYFLTQETAPDGVHSIYTVSADLDGVKDLAEHRTDLLTRWKEGRQP